VHYEGWIYRSNTKVLEPKHKCEIVYFNNTMVEINIIIKNTGVIFVNNAHV